MNWEDLTDRQREAAESQARITLVTGGAGSGKTTAALWAARKALEAEDGQPWERILFLTFSRSAVEQISIRSSRVGDLEDRIEISTFHAFAMRILRAFGAYAGRGREVPNIQSEAHRKLFGPDSELLTYDELVPAALDILRGSARVRGLAERRWPVVICDEFQDTSDDQWELLTLLGEKARLILLADPHQMIYTFVPGVGPQRLRWAREEADLRVELEEASHRDPTGVIPAMAAAVRRREFEDPAVGHALDVGALRIRQTSEDHLVTTVVDELSAARVTGHRSFGIYGHSNEGVARLGAALTDAGVSHTLIGIPEAQGEGLSALVTLTKYAFDRVTESDVRVALATFLTACVRGDAPQLALALAHGYALPAVFAERVDALLGRLREAANAGIMNVGDIAAGAWETLGVTAGVVPWRRASYLFLAVLRALSSRSLDSETAMARLEAEIGALRGSALVTEGRSRSGPATLMNFHQTKGREADAVFLVYRQGDYLAGRYDDEPFSDSSRVLYVALTRARNAVTIILPDEPHPLVRPFLDVGA